MLGELGELGQAGKLAEAQQALDGKLVGAARVGRPVVDRVVGPAVEAILAPVGGPAVAPAVGRVVEVVPVLAGGLVAGALQAPVVGRVVAEVAEPRVGGQVAEAVAGKLAVVRDMAASLAVVQVVQEVSRSMCTSSRH